MRDTCMQYRRNIPGRLICSIKSLCEIEKAHSQVTGLNALRTYVLKLSLRNAIAIYEIERITRLLKIMDKKIRIIKSIKGLSFQLKNFIQCITNDENNIQNDGNQDLTSIYNWLSKSSFFN